MKKLVILVSALSILLSSPVQGQISVKNILKNVKKNTEKKIENKIEKKLNNGVDSVLDGTEKGIKNGLKGSPKTDDKAEVNKKTPVTTINNSQQEQVVAKPILEWSKFDFVPGSDVIFEDNLEGELSGEFPSKWDLFQGRFENANFDGQNVIYCIQCNMNDGGGIVPLIKNANEDYLPDEFTIEFDIYFESVSNSYELYLLDYKNQLNIDKKYLSGDKWLRFDKNGASGKGISENYYPGNSSSVYDKTEKWRHISISFNKRALKVYMDDSRLLNIPNFPYNPTGISLGYHNPSGKSKGYIKNVKIAKGAVPLYDKVLTDGKFVTTGIKFDVNKATIKAESMGTINYVLKMMNDNPALNFSVEGHTDSDGDLALNQALSEQRAKAVVEMLVSMGISPSRLTSKGWGESKPISGNNTMEEKANNRRVEFVKF